MSIKIGILSSDPNESGSKVATAMTEEFEALCASIEAVHGIEFADFVVPYTTLKMSTAQLLGIASRSILALDRHQVAFVMMMPRVLASQSMEIIGNRAEAFVKNNPEHKTIKSVKDFLTIYQSTSDMLMKKMEEYTEGKQV